MGTLALPTPGQPPELREVAVLPSIKLATTPRIVRRLVGLVFLFVLALPVALAFVPWQQTVHGSGMAMAFDPTERTQFVVAPIEGRVKRWHVVEGQRVRAGDLLVEMLDNDPFLIERLQDEEQAIQSQLTFATARVTEIESRISNLRTVLNNQLFIAQRTIEQEERQVEAAVANELAAVEARDIAKITYDRDERQFQHVDELTGKRAPLVSEQQRDNSEASYAISVKRLEAAKKAREAAEKRLEGVKQQPQQITALMEAQINSEKASLAAASESIQTINRSRLGVQTRIARQRQQTVYSPTDGTVFRILANGQAGGQLVKAGERLATLVPDIKPGPERNRQIAESVGRTIGLLSAAPLTPAPLAPQFAISLSPPDAIFSLTRQDYPGIVAELFIDGNDLPLVKEGDRARVQFEGWAAVQFIAFPEAAEGTFGGRVYLVDPTANEKGQFRILVEPDDKPWPEQDLLRQGVRAQGWVLMPNRVTVGWEVWRHLNGFPPSRPPHSPPDEKMKNAGELGPVPLKKPK